MPLLLPLLPLMLMPALLAMRRTPGGSMSSSPYTTRGTPSRLERLESQHWKTKPITLYWRNQAVIEAGPTVRYGARSPSFVAILQACPN